MGARRREDAWALAGRSKASLAFSPWLYITISALAAPKISRNSIRLTPLGQIARSMAERGGAHWRSSKFLFY
jgi:hypothetical protein